MRFINGMLWCDGDFRKGSFRTEDGAIAEVRYECAYRDESKEIIDTDTADLGEKRVIPGFFDIHTHGGAGIDVNAASAEELEKLCCFFAGRGTTRWLCSILTDTKEQTLRTIGEYRKWKKLEHKGAILQGIHLEGPFLSPEYKGAMPEHLLISGDIGLIRQYQEAAEGDIRFITVAPEVDGITDMIPELKRMGIQVAIGHSGASYAQAKEAIGRGACAGTHVGNAMKLFHQHEPAIWGAVLEDPSVYCEMICDGRHLHPGTVRLYGNAKGYKRIVAITDSMMAAGLPDGKYRLGCNDVIVEGGDAKLASNHSRAGSTLTMDQAFYNAKEFTGLSVEKLSYAFSQNPARLLGMDKKIGIIQPGAYADFLVLNENDRILSVYASGNQMLKLQKSIDN